MNAAGALAASGGTLDGAAIRRAQELESILPDEAPVAGHDGALAQATVSSLIEALGGSQAALAYACRTLVAACDQMAKAGGGPRRDHRRRARA